MKIITCIKQVPASSNVQVDPITGVLIRDSQNVKMNPFDLFGLETAFQIKSRIENTSIHAVTMGPQSATQVLKEALYMGADDATLLTDRKFAGADVLATSYTISQLVKHMKDYDLVICGKQTTDGDTAQVGPEMAEFLGIPHVPYVKELIEVTSEYIVVRSAYDQYDEVVKVELPCLLTIEKDANTPRLPSYRRQLSFDSYKINYVTFKDLEDQNENHYGLNGSPTQVDEIFSPDKSMHSTRFEGDPQTLSNQLVEILKDKRFL